MSRQEPRPITEGALDAATWEPNRKRPCPFIILPLVHPGQLDAQPVIVTHIRDLIDYIPFTAVLWPQAGYTTVAEVWSTTAGAIVEKARSKGLKA